jgi:hypothetical protein
MPNHNWFPVRSRTAGMTDQNREDVRENPG